MNTLRIKISNPTLNYNHAEMEYYVSMVVGMIAVIIMLVSLIYRDEHVDTTDPMDDHEKLFYFLRKEK